MERAPLIEKITELWKKKLENNELLKQLSSQIQSKKEEIQKLEKKMAFESNELNTKNNEIQEIERNIKALTESSKDKKGKSASSDNL